MFIVPHKNTWKKAVDMLQVLIKNAISTVDF